MLDYELGREITINMGEMMMRFLYELNTKWQEYLSFYTGLNKKRKEFDQKYEEENGIGEELEEPLGNLTDEEIEINERQSMGLKRDGV